MSIDDNSDRKAFEAHFENWSETAINRYFGVRNSKEELRLDEETANKLRELEKKIGRRDGYEWVEAEGTLVIVDFSKAKEALHFRVDASTSKVNSEAAQLEALQVLVTTLDSSQSLSAVVPLKQKLAVWNAIVANTAVENSEELKVSEEEMEEMQQQMESADEESQGIDSGEVSSEVMNTDTESLGAKDDLVARLRRQGVPEDLTEEVPGMLEKGYSEEEILFSVQGVMGQEKEDGR